MKSDQNEEQTNCGLGLYEWAAAGGIGLKLMNGVNSTKGTWKGRRVDAELAEDVVRAVYLCRVGA